MSPESVFYGFGTFFYQLFFGEAIKLCWLGRVAGFAIENKRSSNLHLVSLIDQGRITTKSGIVVQFENGKIQPGQCALGMGRRFVIDSRPEQSASRAFFRMDMRMLPLHTDTATQ